MDQSTSRVKDLKVGDLVTHVLYGREWIGVIISFLSDGGPSYYDSKGEKALVQIQPGTKHDGFFDKIVARTNRVKDNLGYVSVNWLFKLEEKASFSHVHTSSQE